MNASLLRAKLLRAEVTDAQLHYEGSLAIDSRLMRLVDLMPYEKILVGNITSGERFETYAIPAAEGSLTISLNGATAHLGKIGDLLVIMSFVQLSESEARHWKPRIAVLGEGNRTIVRSENTLPDSLPVGA
ncbi:MAG: aspartate 1-decarboxylase [Opitutales bacterium]